MAFTDEGALVLVEDRDRFLFLLFAIALFFHTRDQRGVPSFNEALDVVMASDYWDGREMAEVMEFLVETGSCARPSLADLDEVIRIGSRFSLEIA